MNATEFKHVEDLFNAALERPAEQRDDYLRDACNGDGEILARVRRLLRYADREVSIVRPQDHRPTRASLTEQTGTAIGPYRIVELIGEGGFGAVYLAEQERPVRRRVALKIIKLGMDTERVIARFEAEQQALALMDHSGIARVFDAGATETGRPYFAMELVEGVPLTEYAETHELSIAERLKLFTLVCHAVQHAHQKGVIHRDLKPSNVMIAIEDGRPVPKVIDFGIAKATNQQLTEKTIFTDFRQLVGTPAYMSPEQAEMSGRDVDTRSDIYSLGVLLYELLTGAFPYRVVGNPNDVLQEIRTAEPLRPGKYRAGLDDDVETIVLKCLHKEPARRYQSAGQLAADLDRCLAGEPIEAKRDSGWYVLKKQVGRHRLALGIAAAFVVMLLTSTVVAWTLYASAERARADATERLWQSYLAQARAARYSDRPGRRFASLEALQAAAAIRPSPELRDEAIAGMALFDVQRESVFATGRTVSAAGLNHIDRVALGDQDGGVAIVEAVDGREIMKLTGPLMPARVMRFTGDGRYLAVKYHSDAEARVWVWDIEQREPVVKLEVAPYSHPFDFDAGGDRVAVALPDATVRIFDLPSGDQRAAWTLEIVRDRLAMHPSGTLIAVASQHEPDIMVIDAVTGTKTLHIPTEHSVFDVEWSRDGRRLAASGIDHAARLYDPDTGDVTLTLHGHQGAVVNVLFGPDDDVVATRSWDGTTRLWDLRNGRPMLGPLENLEVTAFGDRLAMRSDPPGRFELWRVERGRGYQRVEAAAPFHKAALDASHGMLATGGENGGRLWDLDTGRLLAVVTEETTFGVAFVDEGRRLLTQVGEELVSWSVHRDGDAAVLTGREMLWTTPGLHGITKTADRRQVIARVGRVLEFFDLDKQRVVRSWPGYPGMTDPTVSSDGRWVFTGTWKGDPARLWDAEGRVVREFEGSWVRGFFSPDGQWLVVSTHEGYGFYETGTWQHVHRIERGEAGHFSTAFSPTTPTAAIVRGRAVAQLLDTNTGVSLASFAEPDSQSLGDVLFTDDGRLVLSTPGTTIHVWKIELVRQHLRELGLDWK